MSKSTDDPTILPAVSPLDHIKKRVNDTISALELDIPGTPVTPSPLTDPCSTLGGATITTVESGVVTSPQLLPNCSCADIDAKGHCKCFIEHIQQWTVASTKLKATRTHSDVLNQNDLVYDDSSRQDTTVT